MWDKLKEHKGYVILILGLLGLLYLNYDNWFGETETNVEEYAEILVSSETTEASETERVIVEIKGAVRYPGIYEVEEGLRVGEVILIAGGLTEDADISSINQATKISDEMSINIPSLTTTSETVYDTSLVRIVVEIKGEVEHPGVYTVYKNTRVYDLIDLAGGLTDNADTTEVDLAKILLDGETICISSTTEEATEESDTDTERQIYVEISGEVISPGTYLIPETYSIKDLIYEAGGVTVNCDLSKINWDLVLVLGASIYIPSYDDEVAEEDESGLININTASLETLITLPGIGNILGQRIIDYRAEYGDFLSIEDIMNVSGIKESVYEQVKNLITV